MGHPCPCNLLILGTFLFFFFSSKAQSGFSETVLDTAHPRVNKDTSFSVSDFFHRIESLPKLPLPASSLNKQNHKFPEHSLLKPLISNKIFTYNKTGEIAYSADFRAITDTPFTENNILQQNLIMGTFFKIGEIFPVNMFIRASVTNSSYFKNLFDLQLSYDAPQFQRSQNEEYQKIAEELYASYFDSISQKNLFQKIEVLNQLNKWLNNPVQTQKITEYRELLLIDGISFRPEYSFEENQRIEDSLKRLASEFLTAYEKTMNFYNQTYLEVDSINKSFKEKLNKINQIKNIFNQPVLEFKSWAEKRKQLSELGISSKKINKIYGRLQGLRKFGLGRNQVDYSDLTMRNVSVNGINIEYNSWYYASLTAGALDFGYRNLSVIKNLGDQYVYMARVGMGNVERNAIIFSYFGGKKKVFSESKLINRKPEILTNGFSIEGRMVLLKSFQIKGELSETLSPGLNNQKLFSLTDLNNKAAAFSIRSLPSLINTRFEASFKMLGNNYQSFTGYNQNSSRKQFLLRIDHNFFNRTLKVSGKLKSHLFDNPVIIQKYSSKNFSSHLSITYRKKGLPVISIGYVPMSQIYIIDEVLTESNFQSFNLNLHHNYLLFKTRSSSYLSVNKFDNLGGDSSIDFFRTNNFLFSQSLFFKNADIGFSINYGENNYYSLFVIEENVRLKFSSKNWIMGGLKINNYNYSETKLGFYINACVQLKRNINLQAGFERGFLPGYNKSMLLNHYGTMSANLRF